MIKLKKITIILLFVFVFSQLRSYCQSFSANSIKVRSGIGLQMGVQSMGFGINYSAGYQRDIWKDRFRLYAIFSIGHYNSNWVIDCRPMSYTITSIENNAQFDVIKIKSFAVLLASGIFINNINGIMEASYNQEDNQYLPKEKINKFNAGVYVGGGVRINPPTKRFAFSIMPINMYISNNYLEMHAEFEMDIKL